MSSQYDNDIIAKEVREAVEFGKRLGFQLGRADMVKQINKDQPGTLSIEYRLDLTDDILAKLRGIQAEAEL